MRGATRGPAVKQHYTAEELFEEAEILRIPPSAQMLIYFQQAPSLTACSTWQTQIKIRSFSIV